MANTFTIIAERSLDCETATEAVETHRLEFTDFEKAFQILGNYLLYKHSSVSLWIDGHKIVSAIGYEAALASQKIQR